MYIVEYMQNGRKFKTEAIGDERSIRTKFSREGKVVLSVKTPSPFTQRQVRNEEIFAVLTALGDLLGSGVPLTKSLQSVIQSLDRKSRLPGVLLQITKVVEDGEQLSKAMSGYRDVFGTTVISMIQAGEGSGKLSETLLTAADHLRTMQEIKSEMFKKMTYPIVVFIFGVVSLLVNTTFVIPRILNSELFKMAKKAGEGDSIYVVLLRKLALFFPISFVIIAIVIAGLVFLFKRSQQQAEGYLVRLPIVRELLFYRAYYITFSSLSNLIGVGVRLDPALEIVSSSATLLTIRNQLNAARQALKDGRHFAGALTALDPIEKSMLEASQNSDRVHQNFTIISNRFYRLYLEKVRSLGPKVYTMVIGMVFCIFLLMFMGIMVPYFKAMGGIRG